MWAEEKKVIKEAPLFIVAQYRDGSLKKSGKTSRIASKTIQRNPVSKK